VQQTHRRRIWKPLVVVAAQEWSLSQSESLHNHSQRS